MKLHPNGRSDTAVDTNSDKRVERLQELNEVCLKCQTEYLARNPYFGMDGLYSRCKRCNTGLTIQKLEENTGWDNQGICCVKR